MVGVLSLTRLSYNPQTRRFIIKSKKSNLVHSIDTNISLHLEVYQLNVLLLYKAKKGGCVHSLILVSNWEILSEAINSKWLCSRGRISKHPLGVRGVSPCSGLSAEILNSPLRVHAYCCDSICETEVGKVRRREGRGSEGGASGWGNGWKGVQHERHSISFLSLLWRRWRTTATHLKPLNDSVYSKWFHFSLEQSIAQVTFSK